MDESFEQVKALVEQWDYEWGCGPFDECLPEEDALRKLNGLTGRDWTAEEVRLACFEYSSHNSLEETVYYLFYGEYPPVTNVDLVFYRTRPGAVPDAETVYNQYRTGHQMKALESLPRTSITAALRSVPGFQERSWTNPDFEHRYLCMDCLEQPDAWSDVCFHAFWYGGRENPQADHLLVISCHNLKEEQIQLLLGLMKDFGVPFQYQEKDHAY